MSETLSLRLMRYGYLPFGTFGKLSVGDLDLYTVERPWKGNQPSVSCVPAGYYKLVPHLSPNHGPTWALVNQNPPAQVYQWQHSQARRYLILFHAANIPDELEGCIAPGLGFGCVYGAAGVVSSQEAMNRLRKALGGPEGEDRQEHNLFIYERVLSTANYMVKA